MQQTITTNIDMAFVKIEEYDADVMVAIQSDQRFSAKDLRVLALYKKSRSHGNRVQVVYTFGKGYEESHIGRLFPTLGLQGFPHDIRNPLLDKFYWDVDMQNCHYCLLVKMMKEWGLECKSVQQYVDNREVELTKVSKNRRVAKTSFLKCAYGGNIKLYNEQYDDCTNPDGDLTLLYAIEKEIAKAVKYVWNSHEKLQKLVKKKSNPEFSLFALILQTEERKCLLEADAFCKSQKREVGIYIHDGFGLKKKDENFCPPELLTGLSAHIKKTLGYDLIFVGRRFQHEFVLPDVDVLPMGTIVDDLYGARAFVKYMGDSLRYEKQLWIFKDGMWSCDEDILNQAITDSGKELQFRVLTEVGSTIFYNYSGSVKSRENLKKVLKTCVEPSVFLDAGREEAIGKLLFQDGIFDFLYEGIKPFDKNIVFDFVIPFPYKKGSEVDIAFVLKHLFQEPFNNITTPTIFLHFLMRGLIGDYRLKKMLVCLGDTNSSKGTLTNFLQSALGGNTGTFNPDALLVSKGKDPHREIGWLEPHVNRRLLISNEMRVVEGQTINGNILKTIVSGGDTITGRQLYKDETTYVNRSMLILFAQDLPSFSPPDAVANRLIPIQYDYSFVEDVINPDSQKKAFDIKKELNQPKYYYAFIQIMKNEYMKWRKNRYVELTLPDYMVEDRQGLAPEIDLRNVLSNYELTGSDEDFVVFNELALVVKEAGYVISPAKLGRLLKKLGLKKHTKKINRRACAGYSGIKLFV